MENYVQKSFSFMDTVSRLANQSGQTQQWDFVIMRDLLKLEDKVRWSYDQHAYIYTKPDGTLIVLNYKLYGDAVLFLMEQLGIGLTYIQVLNIWVASSVRGDANIVQDENPGMAVYGVAKAIWMGEVNMTLPVAPFTQETAVYAYQQPALIE